MFFIKKDANFLKKWIASIEDRRGYQVFGETIFESCVYKYYYVNYCGLPLREKGLSSKGHTKKQVKGCRN